MALMASLALFSASARASAMGISLCRIFCTAAMWAEGFPPGLVAGGVEKAQLSLGASRGARTWMLITRLLSLTKAPIQEPSRKGMEVAVISPAGYQRVRTTGPFSSLPAAGRNRAGRSRKAVTRSAPFFRRFLLDRYS